MTTTQDSDALKSNGSKTSAVSNLPECWSINQFKSFKQKYDGLMVHEKKLGCDYCGRFASTSVPGLPQKLQNQIPGLF